MGMKGRLPKCTEDGIPETKTIIRVYETLCQTGGLKKKRCTTSTLSEDVETNVSAFVVTTPYASVYDVSAQGMASK